MDKIEDKTRVFLIRHGEVVNPEKIFYGQLNVPLSELGRKQSLEVVSAMTELSLDAVFSSDLDRSLWLAEKLAVNCNSGVEAAKELREADFGKWTGLSWLEIESEFPDYAQAWIKNPAGTKPPDGENMSDLKRRVINFFLNRCREFKGGNIAIVAHGGVNRAIISYLLGIQNERCFSIEQDFACINVIDCYEKENFVIRRINMPSDLNIKELF